MLFDAHACGTEDAAFEATRTRRSGSLCEPYTNEKDRRSMSAVFLVSIGVTGFEPTTPSSLTKCASQLRYTPIFNLKFLSFNRQMLLYMVVR